VDGHQKATYHLFVVTISFGVDLSIFSRNFRICQKTESEAKYVKKHNSQKKTLIFLGFFKTRCITKTIVYFRQKAGYIVFYQRKKVNPKKYTKK